MEPILCVYFGDLLDPSPRHKNQIGRKKPECQRAKRLSGKIPPFLLANHKEHVPYCSSLWLAYLDYALQKKNGG